MPTRREAYNPILQEEIKTIIEQYRAAAQGNEQVEIAAGKELLDKPKPTIIHVMTLKSNVSVPLASDEEDVKCWRNHRLCRLRFKKGATTFLTARRMSGAYILVANLLRRLRWSGLSRQ